MKDKELRKLIGSRAKQRRVELGLNQPYVAEKMGVATSTIVRYEAGTIDNTKKLVLEGLSEALHVSVEWLKGETEEYETNITDKRELFIRDVMSSILSKLPFDMEKAESDFTKDLLLLMLREYELFVDSFQFACKNFKDNAENAALAQTMGFESNKEYNEIMFLREITHTVNMFNDMGDIVRLYSKNPETATVRLANLLSMVLGKNPNRYSKAIGVMIYLHAESISSVPIAFYPKENDHGKRFCKEKRKEMVLPLLCGGRKRQLGTERVYGYGKQERNGKAVKAGNGGLRGKEVHCKG